MNACSAGVPAITNHRSKHDLIIFIQHCHSSYEPIIKRISGWQISNKLDSREGDYYIEKTASDAFYNTHLKKLLSDHAIENITITGLQTEYCIGTICRSALSHGFGVTLVAGGRKTGDAYQSAATMIEQHNRILDNLDHPTLKIQVKNINEL